jgi:hypothetical protein
MLKVEELFEVAPYEQAGVEDLVVDLRCASLSALLCRR